MSAEDVIEDALLERSDELGRISGLLDAAAEGQGCVAVIAAPAGMGKTKLLEAAIADSKAVGARALVARASELESEFSFGLVRQLLEQPVLAASQDERDELLGGAARYAAAALDLASDAERNGDLPTTLHGVYWLLANLSAGSPLVVAVDDIQWGDEPSLRWLAYISRRLEGLPVAVVVTARTDPRTGTVEHIAGASESRRAAIEEILAGASALRFEPQALSAQAVSGLLQRELGAPADDAFTAACRRQTNGNPFLVSELTAELASEGVSPRAQNAALVAEIVPERVGETIRRHLARLGDDARELATSIAVLGEGAELPIAAELSAMELARAEAAAAELMAAQILADTSELRFRHPLLRTAVENEASAIEVASRHRRAAHLLAERGAASGRVGAHLRVSPPGNGEAWAVEQLRAAAHSARAQGAPRLGAELLRRALAEPPPAELRAVVLRELGEAELSFLDDGAIDHLRAAHAATSDPQVRAEVSEAMALGMYHADRHAEGVETTLAAIEEAEGHESVREQRLRLEAVLGLIGRYDLQTEEQTRGRIRAIAADLDGVTPAEQLVKSVADAEKPGPSAADLYEATVRGERVLDTRPWPDPVEGIGSAAMYLHAGRPDAATAFVERLLARSRDEGSPLRHAIVTAARGMVSMDVGELRAADSDFDTAFEALDDLGDEELARRSAGIRLLAFAGLGEFERGEELLVRYGLVAAVPEQMFYNPSLYSRGVFRLAQRRFDAAEADFLELGRRHERWEIVRPVPPWRSGAAEAMIATGRIEEARELAAEELELAKVWDTPKALAIATRALALTMDTKESIPGLTKAVELLEGTPWRLERARARCDLGSALRRSGSRRAGREALAMAMDEAYACGAEPLAQRAAEELRASGARPRRRAISGLDALTPSERRVADLAAAGRTNREIAQELFVTMATVETHLTRVYRKLDVDGRDGLASELESPETEPS